MNKILIAIAAVCFCIPAFAQSAATDKVPVKLGGAATSVADAKTPASVVTRATILSNTVFTVPRKGCDVTGYTFSILPKGNDFIGPFTATGNQLTPKMQQLIKENTGKIFIENIKVKCGATELDGQPLLLKYTE